jgi:hypothetical protein
VRTLARSQIDRASLVDLLSDVETRDSILDHPRLVDAGTASQTPFWFMDFSLSLEKISTGCLIFEKLALKTEGSI